MKAYLGGKLIIEGPLQTLAMGFICDKVELEARDAVALYHLAQRNENNAWFAQFAGRFTGNRVKR